MNTPSEASAELARVVDEMRQEAANYRNTWFISLTKFERFIARIEAALSSHGGGGEAVELVGWVFQHDETGRMTFCENDGINTPDVFAELNPRYTLVSPAYTTPQPRAEGMVLVPENPTQPMRDAGNKAIRMCETEPGMGPADRAFYAYAAMLAAAPGEGSGESIARKFDREVLEPLRKEATPPPASQSATPSDTERLDYIERTFSGMTLRDYFAAKAMQGYCSIPGAIADPAHMFARYAYAMADAMLAARRATLTGDTEI
jgi:hypothetical protein